jgi:hypothetical protein
MNNNTPIFGSVYPTTTTQSVDDEESIEKHIIITKDGRKMLPLHIQPVNQLKHLIVEYNDSNHEEICKEITCKINKLFGCDENNNTICNTTTKQNYNTIYKLLVFINSSTIIYFKNEFQYQRAMMQVYTEIMNKLFLTKNFYPFCKRIF